MRDYPEDYYPTTGRSSHCMCGVFGVREGTEIGPDLARQDVFVWYGIGNAVVSKTTQDSRQPSLTKKAKHPYELEYMLSSTALF